MGFPLSYHRGYLVGQKALPEPGDFVADSPGRMVAMVFDPSSEAANCLLREMPSGYNLLWSPTRKQGQRYKCVGRGAMPTGLRGHDKTLSIPMATQGRGQGTQVVSDPPPTRGTHHVPERDV